MIVAVLALMKVGWVIAVAALVGLAVWVWRTRFVRVGRAAEPAVPPTREDKIERACYAAVVAITLAWVAVYSTVRKDCLVDESGHLGNIYHFLEAKPGWPEAMPMLPGYHFIVVTLWRLDPGVSLVTTARWTTALFALLGFAAFALAWRRIHGRSAGRATLLLALLPLTQPFTGMIYTDVPALALAFCALWAHVTGRRTLAALTLVVAVALRQTNLAWAVFLIAWEWLRTDEPRGTWLRRSAWQLVLLALAAIAIALAGRLTVGTQHGNSFTLNPATVHFAGLLVLLLGLPVWAAHAPPEWRRWREAARAQPGRAAAVAIAGVAAAAGLAVWFANPHIWNRELFWDGCTFTLLRNWPLVAIDAHPWLRVVSGANVVLMAVALWLAFARQARRWELWLAVGFGALPAFTNGLVEPRYFIPAVGFGLVFMELGSADWRRLAWWWGGLTSLHAPFVATALSLW
jgi:hypothetical protein